MTHRPIRRPHRPRPHLLLAGLLLVLGAVTLAPDMATGARGHGSRQLGEFLWGLAGQESGWDWFARNPSSGAFGRYQVMPFNWPSWADRYLGDRWADQDPHNQALVVRRKVSELHDWLGSWRRVAYWWLTGDTETDRRRWSSLARGYVGNVLALMRRAPRGGDPIPPAQARRGLPVDEGDWRMAAFRGALFDRVEGGRQRIATVRDGQVLRVLRSRRANDGRVWTRVVTAGGRAGWISLPRTIPAHRPPGAFRWRDVDRGGDTGDRGDRSRARPRPR